MSYDDDCPDCVEGDCEYHMDPCFACGERGCAGYCDDYTTYNLRPAETGLAAAQPED